MTDSTTEVPQDWSYRSLLFCGHFGGPTEASRRLNRNSAVAMIGFAVVFLGSAGLRAVWDDALWLTIPATVGSALFLLAEYRRYFAQLDELSLRIQYEGITFAFSVMLVAGFVLGSAAAVFDFSIPFVLVVLAEPLRGIGLVRAARRYR